MLVSLFLSGIIGISFYIGQIGLGRQRRAKFSRGVEVARFGYKLTLAAELDAKFNMETPMKITPAHRNKRSVDNGNDTIRGSSDAGSSFIVTNKPNGAL